MATGFSYFSGTAVDFRAALKNKALVYCHSLVIL